jgi:mediator of RNA polymerase II transcription subunit 12
VFDLRQIVLNDAGLLHVDGRQNVERLQQRIAQLLQPTTTVDHYAVTDFSEHFIHLNLSDKFALSLWLRQIILELTQTSSCDTIKEADFTPQTVNVSSLRTFLVARSVLESLEDFAILADVIGICLASEGMDTLSSIVDTLHYHHRCLAAIGAFKPLLEQVIERYQLLRDQAPLERSVVRSLLDLCSTIHAEENLLQQLNYDLARCEHRNTIAMCSPASDNAADILISSHLDSDDEIDRILSSGTTMDEHSLARVFKRLVSRLEENCANPTKPPLCGKWFSHLRSFDESTFDGVMREWLSSTTLMSNPRLYRQILPTLIGSDCLTLSTFVQIVDDCKHMSDADNYPARITLELGILEAIIPPISSQTPATVPVSR